MNTKTVVQCVLAVACVIQTSLIVSFTVTHVQRQKELQQSYRELTERARRLLFTCGEPERMTGDPDVVTRDKRQTVQGDPFIQQLISEQEAILKRHCDNDTKLCLPGPKGESGPTGPPGISGGQGPIGDQGQPGIPGESGDSGLPGAVGKQGPEGPKGETGDSGPPGPKGSVGLQGPKGETGVRGSPGQDGVNGPPGAKGEPGAGLAGDKGVKGQPGLKGDPGQPGAPGPPGPDGAKGESGVVPGEACPCIYAPKTLEDSVEQDVFEGGTLTLMCPVEGFPTPEITWSRADGTNITEARSIENKLVIPNFDQVDAGKYICTARNVLGSASVNVNVKVSDLNCEFEEGYCQWSQSVHDQMNWKLNRGTTNTKDTGPDADHTQQTAAGQYAYLETSEGHLGEAADLQSPLLDLKSPVCVEFWYNMYGADIANLSVIVKNTPGNESVVWTAVGNQGQNWKFGEVSVTPASGGGQTQIILRAVRGKSIAGDIAIDDVKVTDGLCVLSSAAISCLFQMNDCGWTRSGTWPWKDKSGSSGKPDTGPSADHSGSASGFYVYADGSDASPGNMARLTSPLIRGSTEVCVQYYYHMYGSDEGSLALNIKSEDSSEYTLWQRAGNQRQEWQQANVTIPKMSSPYSLVFEATRGDGPASDVAVDDVKVTDGACSPDGVLGCDFEHLDLCTWHQGEGDAFDWELQIAKAGGISGGPIVDETMQTGEGHYASISSQGHSQGQEGVLVSRTLHRQTVYCLSLWYYIPSPDSGRIDIYREVGKARQMNIGHIISQQPVGWKLYKLSIPTYDEDYAVQLVGVAGTSGSPPLAIDDISLEAGSCQP